MAIVNGALVGCGDIAQKRVAPALCDLQSCELIAVYRSRADLAESFANQFGARRWYRHWHELTADQEVDAVYIATPVHLHAFKQSPPQKPGIVSQKISRVVGNLSRKCTND